MVRLLFLFLILAGPATADAWDVARAPGAVLLMRHEAAPGSGDPATVVIGDCTTQRNLSDAGRAAAIETGKAIRAAGIALTLVATSQWCRTRDTARLLDVAPVEDWPELNSTFNGQGDVAAQRERVLRRLAGLPPGTHPLLVTHQVNISALTGLALRSGEIAVVRIEAGGGVEMLGRIDP